MRDVALYNDHFLIIPVSRSSGLFCVSANNPQLYNEGFDIFYIVYGIVHKKKEI